MSIDHWFWCFALRSLNYLDPVYVRTDDWIHSKPLPLPQLLNLLRVLFVKFHSRYSRFSCFEFLLCTPWLWRNHSNMQGELIKNITPKKILQSVPIWLHHTVWLLYPGQYPLNLQIRIRSVLVSIESSGPYTVSISIHWIFRSVSGQYQYPLNLQIRIRSVSVSIESADPYPVSISIHWIFRSVSGQYQYPLNLQVRIQSVVGHLSI